jgi:hypothetical protein
VRGKWFSFLLRGRYFWETFREKSERKIFLRNFFIGGEGTVFLFQREGMFFSFDIFFFSGGLLETKK